MSDSPFFWIPPRFGFDLLQDASRPCTDASRPCAASSILRIRFVHFLDASRPLADSSICGFDSSFLDASRPGFLHFADSSFLWIIRLMDPFPMELLGGSFQGIGPQVHDVPDRPVLWLDNHALLPMSR